GGGRHRGGLALEAGLADAAAGADPVLRPAAIERVIERRRDGGVADAHLAEAEEVEAAGRRFHAEGDRGGAFGFAHRRRLCDVAARLVDAEVVDLEAEVEGEAELVD